MPTVTVVEDERLHPFALKTCADGAEEVFLGSGFVAAPGFALTCAHVVAGLHDRARIRVVSSMPQLRGARAVVRARSPLRAGPDGLWPWPDLAILELCDAEGRRLTDHPCPRVRIGSPPPRGPEPLRAVVAARLNPDDERSEVHLRSVGFRWESVDDHGFWWLKGGHALSGMSGSMLLDDEHRAVVGVVNNSRSRFTDVGAVAVPLNALLDHDRHDDDFASAAGELREAIRDSGRRAKPEWDGAFTRREQFEWRDYWAPDTRGDHFVGRREELAELETALEQSHGIAVVQSIAGFGGVGKTALAVAFSERSRGRFPDGRVFHDFHSYRGGRSDTATEALGSILTAIGAVRVDEVSKLSHSERVHRWQTVTAGRRLLMVWDNVDDKAQLDGLIVDAEGCATIVTSRDAVLGKGRNHLALDVLDPDDAVAMFCEIAGYDHPPELVEQLVGLDLYVPVLIRTHATEIANAVSRLREIINDLPEPSQARHRSDADRQRDLFGRLHGSYRRLTDQERLAFRVLGAHPGYRATTGSLTAAMGCDPDQTRRRMGALIRAGLATSDYTDDHDEPELCTYRAHDLIRAYGAHLAEHEPAAAADGTADTELARVHTALVDYYFEHIGGPTPSNRRDWFSVEADSIRDLVLAGDGERTGHLARFLGYRGIVFSRYDAAEAGFLHAKAIDERRGDTARTAHCLWGLGEIARLRNDLDLARRRYGEARALSRRADDPGGIGNAERGLAEVAQFRGDADAARTHYEAAMEVYRAADNRHRIVYVQRGLARVAELKGDHDLARDLFETALAGSREEGDTVGAASAERGLADVALAAGDLREAEDRYRASHAGFTDAGDPVSAARATQGVGRAALARGDRATARAHFEQAREVFDSYDATIWLQQVQTDLDGLDALEP
ncbi:tetratricopeptide repeat protein [Glycomyces xiaoerkulensis]|uniref:tetratricopeptide repeat protein n=1 Tax=Glycomyces xiaoerkulensis TaxID=2038139 RepID=UPI000C25B9FB|nr:tetratricopeptide repeat protein [Glycomyces xiaoerkulensis]